MNILKLKPYRKVRILSQNSASLDFASIRPERHRKKKPILFALLFFLILYEKKMNHVAHHPELTPSVRRTPLHSVGSFTVIFSASRHLYELLGRVHLGFLVVARFRIACNSSTCKELRPKPIPDTAWPPITFFFRCAWCECQE
jgi:hypothetical protein